MITKPSVDGQTKSNLIKIFGNFSAFFIVSMCCLLWQNFAKTAKRGFFCNDETLMATFHGEVVSVKVLLIVSIAVPIITIVLIEFIGKSRDNEKSFKIFNFAIAQKIVEASHYVSTFLFGFVINLLVTQMGKYLVARYRPHFLTSCQPVFPDGTNCSHAVNIGRNIDTFECSNPLLNDFEDLRRSWPSGHSSISFYSMIFLSVYIFMQKKDFLRELRLLKISTIFVFISFAWISSLSRIGDNKHHWTDVVSGVIIGSLIAVFIITQIHSSKSSLHESTLPMISRKTRNESVETLRL